MSDYSGLRDGYYESRVLAQILRSRHQFAPHTAPGYQLERIEMDFCCGIVTAVVLPEHASHPEPG